MILFVSSRFLSPAFTGIFLMLKFLALKCVVAFTVMSLMFVSADVLQADDVKPIRALLVLGGCCHDYNTQKDLLAKGIAERAHVEVVIAYDKDTTTSHLNPVYEKADWAEGFDVIIHDECSSDVKDLAIIDRILEPHRQGLPAVLLHCGMHSYRSEGYPKAVTPWFEFTGLQSTGHGRQAPINIGYVATDQPIMHGLADQLIFPEGTIDYYQWVVQRMGSVKETMNFARLFLIPGFDHGNSGPKPINNLESIIRWVEENKPPEVINAELRDKSGKLISKRKLFPYSASSSIQVENK